MADRLDARQRLQITSEARAALAGLVVAVMLLTVLAIRLAPHGSSIGRPLADVSTRTPPAFWVVQSGQTLDLIAERTGVSTQTIEQLNPDADPGRLVVGQRVRLRDGSSTSSRSR
jgi:LysM domain